jgi:hypothetical protein
VSEQLSDNDSALLAYMTGAAEVDVESSDDEEEEEGEAAVVTRRTQQQQGQQQNMGGGETKGDGKGASSLRPLGDSSAYLLSFPCYYHDRRKLTPRFILRTTSTPELQSRSCTGRRLSS